VDESLSRADQVTHALREAILLGIWKPRECLPGEREIASRLGVNRSSVRAGLKQLEQLRLVAIRPGGRATVIPPEDASIEVLRHLPDAGDASTGWWRSSSSTAARC